LHFTVSNDEVLANLDGVYQRIAEEVGRITPPKPSPIKGEGRNETKFIVAATPWDKMCRRSKQAVPAARGE
jgi:hypothetical protein